VFIMQENRTLAEWMTERGMSLAELADAAALDKRVVEAIALGRYTSSPEQRAALAAVLALTPEQILWARGGQVDHMYGHGPQFGRSP
jgi:hypothetical protein